MHANYILQILSLVRWKFHSAMFFILSNDINFDKCKKEEKIDLNFAKKVKSVNTGNIVFHVEKCVK